MSAHFVHLRNMLKKIISILIAVLSETMWILVDGMLLMAFISLTSSTIRVFLVKDITREIVISYIGGIALCFSLASVLFSYARISEGKEKQNAVKSGRTILNGGVILLISFMLNFYLTHDYKGDWEILQLFINYSRPFALGGSICFSAVSGLELHRGFRALLDNIFYKEVLDA